VNAGRKYEEMISKEDLHRHLSARETLVFTGRGVKWQEVERQVEELGFGDLFYVANVAKGGVRVTKVSPIE
jgi:hypothetical protein